MITGKRIRSTLGEHLKDDASLLKDFSDLLSFGMVLTSAGALTPALGVALILKCSGAVLSASTRIIGRLSNEAEPTTRTLLNSYERFRAVFYVACQRAYFQALAELLPTLKIADTEGIVLDPTSKDFEKVVKRFQESAAQIGEAEIRFHYSIDPTDKSMGLYKTYSNWLGLALQSLGIDHSHQSGIVAAIEKDARKRFNVALAGEDATSQWMRNYLALEFQANTHEKIMTDLNSIQKTLEGWKVETSAAQRSADRWLSYRQMLSTLPDQKETMFDEDFGVREVFVAPQVSYHRAGLAGNPDEPELAPDIGRLIGALFSTRLTGDDLVFLCGGPGCGKSTLCRILASELAKDKDIYPIFISLRRCKEGAELSAHLEDVLVRENLIHRLADLQAYPNVFLILDGFDELVMASRSRLRHFFKVLLDDLRIGPLRQCRVLVAGRDTLFPKGEGLPRGSHVLNILPFDKTRVALWGDKWRQRHPDVRAQTFRPESFVELPEGRSIKKTPLHQLVSWPLTLHLIARTHTAGLLDVQPKVEIEKAYLYRSILAETAIRQDEQTQGKGRLDPQKMRAFLRSVAWRMYSRSVDSLDPPEVIPMLSHFFPTANESDFNELAEVAVLNAPQLQKGEETGFEFVHKSFAEYLTAELIAQAVEDASYKVQEITGEYNWRRSLREASRSCGAKLGVRPLPSEVQEMFEPMLGVWSKFDRGDRVQDVVSGIDREDGLGRVLERFHELYNDLLTGEPLIAVGDSARGEGRNIGTLEAFGNYAVGLVLIGAAAARQLGRIRIPPEVFFRVEPFEGAFWKWLSMINASGIQVDTNLAHRLFVGLTIRPKPEKRENQVHKTQGDQSLPIKLVHLKAIDGYASTFSENLSSIVGIVLVLMAVPRQIVDSTHLVSEQLDADVYITKNSEPEWESFLRSLMSILHHSLAFFSNAGFTNELVDDGKLLLRSDLAFWTVRADVYYPLRRFLTRLTRTSHSADPFLSPQIWHDFAEIFGGRLSESRQEKPRSTEP